MLGNNKNQVEQKAITGRDSFQAARDANINISNVICPQFDIDKFEIYEEDIKDTIQFFYSTMEGLKDIPFPDNTSILIEEKNAINKLSELCFKEIKEKSLAYFGKIRAFLKKPENSMYVEMYNSTSLEIQQIINAIRPGCDSFDSIFPLLYAQLITPYKRTDSQFMRIRTFVYVFLHFMYYNCDIGIKVVGEAK